MIPVQNRMMQNPLLQKQSARAVLRIPHPMWFVLIVSALFSLLFPNPFVGSVAILVLPVLARWTWRPSEPPVLFFVVFFQWLQVSMAVFYANFHGVNVSAYPNAASTEMAVWLSLAGLLVLALGMKIGVKGIKEGLQLPPVVQTRYSEKKIFYLYLFLFVLAGFLPPSLGQANQLRTIILGFLQFKWVALFIIAYLAFARGMGLRNRYLLIGIGLEVLWGFSGYFSGFKHVFFIVGIAYLATRARMKEKDMFPLAVIVLVVFVLSVCWTSIKTDYRDFLNQQSGQQVVLVPVEKRVQAVVGMVLDIDTARFVEGVDKLFQRVAYIEMFARVIDTVPAYLPHEGGRLWWAALKHVTIPRALFPGKAVLPSDSELTMKYTRTFISSAEQGTSISMGYMAESYIDFGVFAMYVPIFLCGLLWGGMYRYFMRRVPDRLIAYGMVTALLVNANQFEMHSVKLLGGMLMNFLIFAAVAKFVLPKHLGKLAARF